MEYDPHQLVEQARLAEEAGFEGLWISDHYHPWNDEQGQSPFVWGVIGAISRVCRLPVTTAVTAPTVRLHPAVVAQAAATAAVQLGDATLGVGTGEALNEHILADGWPAEPVRLEMLEEAVTVLRELWKGDYTYHYGRHYTVENARVYTRPERPPAIYLSAFGDESFDLALRVADGFITTQPDVQRLQEWRAKAGPEKPTQGGYKGASPTPRMKGSRSPDRLWPPQACRGAVPGAPSHPGTRAGQRARHS